MFKWTYNSLHDNYNHRNDKFFIKKINTCPELKILIFIILIIFILMNKNCNKIISNHFQMCYYIIYII